MEISTRYLMENIFLNLSYLSNIIVYSGLSLAHSQQTLFKFQNIKPLLIAQPLNTRFNL